MDLPLNNFEKAVDSRLAPCATSALHERDSGRRRYRPSIALLGNFDRPEFVPVRRQIKRDADNLKVREFAVPAELVSRLTSPVDLELVVSAQQRPGEWDGGWLDQLRAKAPLARTVVVVGPWCMGETRTGKPLAADVRLSWNEFPLWWARQIERRRNGWPADWSFFQASLGRTCAGSVDGSRRASPGLILIAANSRESAEAIALACEAGGWSSVWVHPPLRVPLVRSATAIVLDGAHLENAEFATLKRLRTLYGPLPVVALSDNPMPFQSDSSRTAGIQSILGKPYRLDDFHAALEELAG